MKRRTYYEFDGSQRIRIRETYVRDVLGVLVAQRRTGLVKLDIVLRGLARRSRQMGEVHPELAWETIHDLCRPVESYSADDAVLKRKWVSENLRQLEGLGSVQRHNSPNRRPVLQVQSDSHRESNFDDPGASGDAYVTFPGDLIAFGHLASFGTAEICATFAAINAERYSMGSPDLVQALKLEEAEFGQGVWYRPLSWFQDQRDLRPATQVRFPFSESTLKRGLKSLKAGGFVATANIKVDPRTGKEFSRRSRSLYFNGFDDVRGTQAQRRARLHQKSADHLARIEDNLIPRTAVVDP